MSPLADTDGHDAPRLIDEPVPGLAAVVDDVVVGFEDTVRQPVVAHELPDVLDGVELGASRRQRHQGNVGRHDQLGRAVPSGLIEDDHGMGARGDVEGDLFEMHAHRLAVAGRHNDARRLSFKGADRAEDPCRGAALIPWRRWPGAAPCPSPGQLGLLANSCLVLPPQLYGRSSREAAGDARQTRGEAFLKSAMSSVFWPLWRGRAESLRKPRARISRLSDCLEMDKPNSSHTHCARSISRQRTTPCAAGIGPASTCAARARRCVSLRIGGLPGALRGLSPSGPSALNRITQSRTIWSVTPPIFAASLRLMPSRIEASANSRRTCTASSQRRARPRKSDPE